MRLALRLILLFFGCTLSAVASVTDRVLEHRTGLRSVAGPLMSNPAVRQWQFDSSLTQIELDCDFRRDHGILDPREGSVARHFKVGADTYTKYKSSTLWGWAQYSYGRTDDVRWRESSDADMIYPYISADSVGGDLKSELYGFGGGYADHRGRWSWGLQLSYLAGLDYRQVDPRPRNVCGTLDARIGAGYSPFDDYTLNVGFDFRRYKQTDDIMFKSEMGSEKVFHLIGPVVSCKRFDGASDATYYTGYRYGAGLSLYPASGRGGFVGVDLSRFSFDYVMTGLNRLPLARLWHNSLNLRMDWMFGMDKFDVGLYAALKAARRHGTENIFGDPASGVYPLIGSMEMYARNKVDVSAVVRAVWRPCGLSRLSAALSGAYDRTVCAYRAPRQYSRIKYFNPAADLRYDRLFSKGYMLILTGHAMIRRPFDCVYTVSDYDTELSGLAAVDEQRYMLDSHGQVGWGIGLGLTIPVGRYAVQLSTDWQQQRLTGSCRRDFLSATLAFVL